jgi:hypothetical protein
MDTAIGSPAMKQGGVKVHHLCIGWTALIDGRVEQLA